MTFCTAGHVDHGKTALVRALTGVDTDRLAEERRRGLTIELGFAPLELPGFCTAGHVDHGKTALVRALTGVDTDRLAEERRRGLTIELGFAPLELPGVGRVSLVDVPGHAQFIPTMLSGCGGLDGALFTVAADEGPMPQTAEHLDILSLLGLERGVVALTRADLASPAALDGALFTVAADEGPMPQTAEHLDILSLLGLERGVVALTRADLASPAARAEAEAPTRALTAGPVREGAPPIFVSAVTGEGLEALRAALAAMARQAPPPPEGSPRLHVDRVFSVDGSGTVVTGTLTGGPLRRGDRVQLYPGGQTARVRGLQCHGVPAEALPAGVRAAVNLAAVRLRDVGRGGHPGCARRPRPHRPDRRIPAGAPRRPLSRAHRKSAPLPPRRPRPGVVSSTSTTAPAPWCAAASSWDRTCSAPARRGGPSSASPSPSPPPPATGLWRASSPPWPRWEAACWWICRPPARAACGRSGWPGWPPWRRGGPSRRWNPPPPQRLRRPLPRRRRRRGSWRPSIWGTAWSRPPGRGWSPALPGGSGRRAGPAAA